MLGTDDPDDALCLADDHTHGAKSSVGASARGQSLAVLSKALAERRVEQGHHIDDVATLSGLVAERLGLSAAEQQDVEIAAELALAATGKLIRSSHERLEVCCEVLGRQAHEPPALQRLAA